MKALPKRKGNACAGNTSTNFISLNESPSEKEGKYGGNAAKRRANRGLNESPSEKEGKSSAGERGDTTSTLPQ